MLPTSSLVKYLPSGLSSIFSEPATIQVPRCEDYLVEIHIHNFPMELVNDIFKRLEPCFALNMLCTDKTFNQNPILKAQQFKMKILKDYSLLQKKMIPKIEKLLPYYNIHFISKLGGQTSYLESTIKILASYNHLAAFQFFRDRQIPTSLIRTIKSYEIDCAFEYLKSEKETTNRNNLLIQLAQSYAQFGDNDSSHRAKEILSSVVRETLNNLNTISINDDSHEILIYAAKTLLNIDAEKASLITDCLVDVNLMLRNRSKPAYFALFMQIAHLKALINEQEGCALMEKGIEWLNSLPSIDMRPNEKDLCLKSIAPKLEPFKSQMEFAINSIKCPITKIEMLHETSLPIYINHLNEALEYVSKNLPTTRIKNLSFLAYLYQKVDPAKSKTLIAEVFTMLNKSADANSALFEKSLGEAIKAFPPYDKTQVEKFRSSISALNFTSLHRYDNIEFKKVNGQIKLAECYKLINPELALEITEYALSILLLFNPQTIDEETECELIFDRISNLIVQFKPEHTYLFYDKLGQNIKDLEKEIEVLRLDSGEEILNLSSIDNLKIKIIRNQQNQKELLSSAIEGLNFDVNN